MFHCLTCGIRHSAPDEEFQNTVRSKAGNVDLDMNMLRGYQRLPYDIKGKLLTGILVASSEYEDETSKNLLNNCFQALQEAFSSLVNALS
jgi:hypothetical protein